MNDARTEQWQRLIDLIDQADALQQQLLGETKDVESYAIHEMLNNMIDNFVDLANEEGIDIG
jgi:t-SNARE complex subunit (syntaxin)